MMTSSITNSIVNVVTNKPFVAALIAQSGIVATLLMWVGILTPLIAFIATVFGAIVGFLAIRPAYKKWREAGYKTKIHPKK